MVSTHNDSCGLVVVMGADERYVTVRHRHAADVIRTQTTRVLHYGYVSRCMSPTQMASRIIYVGKPARTRGLSIHAKVLPCQRNRSPAWPPQVCQNQLTRFHARAQPERVPNIKQNSIEREKAFALCQEYRQ